MISTNPSEWIWMPNVSHGPFIFGTHKNQVSYLTELTDASTMGYGDVVTDYTTQFDQVTASFWNDRLTDITLHSTFRIKGIELIGSQFEDVKHLIAEEPIIEDYEIMTSADFDRHGLICFVYPGRTINNISVGIDPDLLNDQPARNA